MTATLEQSEYQATPRQIEARRPIALWLFVICALVGGMVIVGGATRLTDSGLSITEWKPVTGAIPPFSQEVWESEFEKYKQIPEYIEVNRGMSLEEFKTIYWWEWGHRFLGRLVGIAFFVPFMWFLLTKRLERPLIPPLVVMFIMGGLQGAMGWYMVMSGLTERVDVSQYRLAAHLGLAFIVYGYMYWVALSLWRGEGVRKLDLSGLAIPAAVIVAAVFVQILAGAFVAGLNAGLIFNTWPFMEGAIVPDHLFPMGLVSAFEDVRTVQFDHRMLAYAVTALIGWHYWVVRNADEPIQKSAHILLAVLLVQVGLGIMTLLSIVRIDLALAHQLGALALLSAALYHLDTINRTEKAG